MGLIGGVAGWKGAIAGFFLACILGSIYGVGRLILCRDRYLPFGPFLAAGGLVLTQWPSAIDALFVWYVALFRP
jgi:leader peptidase (prepilin peptidase)/N-methyltransferase